MHVAERCNEEEEGGTDRSGVVTFHLSTRSPQVLSQILLAERTGQSKPVEFCAVMAGVLQCLMCWCHAEVAT